MILRSAILFLFLLAARPRELMAGSITVVGGQTNGNPHYVFAHYMVALATYGATVDGYRREIMEAQAANIDGFALNVGAWDDVQGYYSNRVSLIYQAAEQLGTGFKLFFSVDFENPTNIVSMVESYADRPNTFRYRGRVVLSSYGHNDVPSVGWPGMDWTNAIIGKLKQDGYPVFFIPHFWPDPPNELPNSADADQILAKYAGILDGLFLFDPAGELDQTIASTANYAYSVSQAGKLFMACFSPHYWGCNQYSVGRRYYETLGGEGTELQWEQLIANQPDWVEIVTWNDFDESTYISPVVNPGQYFSGLGAARRNTHAGYLELSKYYISWYKSGYEPAIDRDALFYFYRIAPLDLVITNDVPVTWVSPYESDQIFLTTMLKSPATLVVTSGGVQTNYTQAAGINSVRVPFLPGPQTFEVWRSGSRVAVVNGPPVTTALTNYNFFPTSGFAYLPDVAPTSNSPAPAKVLPTVSRK
jgi:glucan endo-1,3-alpha-glucosidase